MESYSDYCWYQDVCTKKTDTCMQCCIRYLEMKFLMDNSGIPKNRQMPAKLNAPNCDVDAFRRLSRIKDDIVPFVDAGKGLYIAGETTGNGKTTWAIKLMTKYFNDIWAGNGLNVRGLFIHIPTFLLKCKDFNNIDPEFEAMKKLIPEVDLVVWDDIASVNTSAYDYSQLLMYLDVRVSNGKSNIYTGNIVSKKALEDALGSKLTSRILGENTEFIEFKGGDRR